MNTVKLMFAIFGFTACVALPVMADDYQYVWDKTTSAEETVTDWPSLPSNGTHYASYPFILKYSGQHFLQLCTDTSKEACGNEHAVAEIVNCNARVSYLNKVFRMDIDSGTYNWLDPFGMTWKTMPYVEWLRNANIKTVVETQIMGIHGGTTRWPSIYMKGWCKNDDYFTFDGGSHYIGGTVTMPYDADSASGLMPAMHFDVTNGAKVGIHTFTMGSGTSSYVEDRDLYFTVASGADVTISNSFAQTAPSGAVGTGLHRQHVLVKDATLRVGPSAAFHLGAQSTISMQNIENEILFTNAAFIGENQFSLHHGTATFVDSVITNKNHFRIGECTGSDARLELKNCQTYLTNPRDFDRIIVGYSGAGTLYVEGGSFYANEIDVGQNWSATAYVAATGTLALAANTTVKIDSLYLGKRYGALGKCTLGPSQTIDCTTSGLTLGRSGVAELTIAGGTCNAAVVEMGSSTVADLAKAPGTNLLHVTAGTLTVKSVASGGGIIVGTRSDASGTRACRCVFEGGTVTTPRLVGNVNPQWSELVGNGGTVKANRARTDWFGGLDRAALGATGLTLDSDGYNVTIAQDFSNLNGAAGVLTLTGAGTKTLTGTASAESKLVVAGGSVVFADTARHASAVSVVNGASVAFAGAADSGMIKGLTLGDAMTGGELALVKDKTIAVDGDLVVHHARFTLGAGFALDTTSTVFSVTGTVSDETMDALNESVMVSGLPSGAAFEFLREPGVSGNPTLVKLVVREAVEIVVEATEGRVTDSAEHKYAAADSLTVRAAADAALTLSGKLSKGGFAKEGAGTVYLTNGANRFLGSVALYEGRLSVSSLLALGYDANGTGEFHLKGGTLELADEEEPAAVFPYKIVTDPETANAPVVIKTDAPTVVKSLTCTSGALFKRGKSPLVFCADADVTWTGGSGNTGGLSYWQYMVAPATGWAFDDDKGTLPGASDYYNAFNVVEGDVVFTSPGETRINYDFRKSIRLGVPTQVRSAGAPDPRLIIDHAKVTTGNNANRAMTSIGASMSAANSDFHTATLVLTNNACLYGRVIVGNAFSVGCAARFDLYDSTLEAESSLNPCGATFNLHNSRIYANKIDMSGNSSIGAICTRGESTFNLNNSVLSLNEAGDPFEFFTCYDIQTVNCTNGSRFCCSRIRWWNDETVKRPNVFRFDDSEWYPGATDFTFNDVTAGTVPDIGVTGKGLVLAPPTDCTYTFNKTITGTGGLVKRAEGTLVIPAANLVATGTVALEAGTLDFDGGTLSNPLALTGGTLANVTLTTRTVEAPVAPEGLSFNNVVFSNVVRFDFGEAVLPESAYAFATYTGTAPNVAKWRTARYDATGRRLVFSAADGVITATPQGRPGLAIIVR